jgi:hypothetical protein
MVTGAQLRYDAGMRPGMIRLLFLVALAGAGATLAGCSACDFPLYVPQGCRSGPPAAPDAPPPGG